MNITAHKPRSSTIGLSWRGPHNEHSSTDFVLLYWRDWMAA